MGLAERKTINYALQNRSKIAKEHKRRPHRARHVGRCGYKQSERPGIDQRRTGRGRRFHENLRY